MVLESIIIFVYFDGDSFVLNILVITNMHSSAYRDP